MLSRRDRVKVAQQLNKVADLLEMARNAAGEKGPTPATLRQFEWERGEIPKSTQVLRTRLEQMGPSIERLTSRIYKKSGFDEEQLAKYGGALTAIIEHMGGIEDQCKILDGAAELSILTPGGFEAGPGEGGLTPEERAELMAEPDLFGEPTEIELEGL